MDIKELLLINYDLTNEDISKIVEIIKPIYNHLEFQKRLTNEFLHHGKTTLGMHIIEDTIYTYKFSKKYLNKNYRLDLALKISMFYDLYTKPWQNSKDVKKYFSNKHGFRHPVEAIINACTWFKEDFTNINDAKIIIDGVIHHMYPFPVVILNNKDINTRELNNFELFKELPQELQNIIIESTFRNKLFNLSWSRSKYKEGRIVSLADKRASLKEFNNIYSVLALITGKNKSLKNK